MKVLGISFGRRNERCDILVKEALFAAKKAGADVQFINTMSMNITHCHACDYCSRQKDNGDVEVGCAFKDGYQELAEAYWDADGIIIGAPVYAVGIVGQFKNFLDRLCPAHDRASLLETNKKREAAGQPLLDSRYFKDHYSGYISVGGAQSHHWVSLGLPMLHLFDFSMVQKCVGHVDAYDQGRTGSPLLDKDLMKLCADLGSAVANSIGKPYDEVDTWVGPKGACPVCHNELISFSGSTHVECPICGIRGEMKFEGADKVSVHFSDEEKKRARNTLPGIYEHYDEIQNMIKVCVPKLTENKEFLETEKKKYVNFEETLSSL